MNQTCFRTSLCKTNHGEVCLSHCGRRFKITFQNLIIVHDYNSYITFFNSIEECQYAVKESNADDERNIHFCTPFSNIAYRFSTIEIAELYYLLQSALIEVKIYV